MEYNSNFNFKLKTQAKVMNNMIFSFIHEQTDFC